MSISSVEELVVTYSHRPVKSEPINHTDSAATYPPQLDGQIDLSPTLLRKQKRVNDKEEHLNNIIAKVNANRCPLNKVIQINRIPTSVNKYHSHGERKSKAASLSAKKVQLSTSKVDQKKELGGKDTKTTKKNESRLLQSVLKHNEDAIRPLYTQIPFIQTNIQVGIFVCVLDW
jgi:hypothetical protein